MIFLLWTDRDFKPQNLSFWAHTISERPRHPDLSSKMQIKGSSAKHTKNNSKVSWESGHFEWNNTKLKLCPNVLLTVNNLPSISNSSRPSPFSPFTPCKKSHSFNWCTRDNMFWWEKTVGEKIVQDNIFVCKWEFPLSGLWLKEGRKIEWNIQLVLWILEVLPVQWGPEIEN